MKFQRKSDGLIVSAKVWQRNGDHPKVRPATKGDLPALSDPGKLGWIDGVGVVFPGDLVVTDADGSPSVVRERSFRQGYLPCAFNDLSA